jgi:hypothetical protein
MAMTREHGKEQPYIPLGLFKLRIPFIHFKWEWPEAIQGAILVAVALGSIPLHQEILGVPFEAALVMVALNGILYVLHPMFGDPVFPGWITPAIPLVMVWTKGYAAGPDRIHAMIALQLSMAIIFFVLGVTGAAKKIVSFVPLALRAGIILGAGIAAVWTVVMPKGRMTGQEWTIMIGAFICWLVLFSFKFAMKKKEISMFQALSKYGMLPGIIVAAIVGPIIGEIPFPKLQMGIIDFGQIPVMLQHSMLGVGFPPVKYWIDAIPLVFAAYIIAFGDFVLAEVVTREAEKTRGDEHIEFNPNRSNIISAIRNLIMGVVAPYGPLCGPLWAGGTIAIAERYKHGRTAMDSIYGGAGTFTIAMFIASLFLPIISLVKPVLPAALSLTLLVQGFACFYIAMDMCKTNQERGVAGIMAIFLAAKSAAWGLAVGALLWYIIGNSREESKE